MEHDRLNSLPDCLLVSILSLLPTKTAVSTSVLSHRWQNLWTQLSVLSFTGPQAPREIPRVNPSQEQLVIEFISKFDIVTTAVSDVLRRITSPKILKFELTMDLPSNGDPDHYDWLVGSWVRLVCSRHPEDISIILKYYNHRSRRLKIPGPCIFQCETLVSLHLGNCLVHILPDDVEFNLPNLKRLTMSIYDFQPHRLLLIKLFKCCPLLEDLWLKVSSDERQPSVVEIVCPNLKSLKVEAFTRHTTAEFVIDAPKLENIFIKSGHTWYRFVNHPRELAKVEIKMWYFNEVRSDEVANHNSKACEVFRGISSARSLDLNGQILKCCLGPHAGRLEVFHNLTVLRIGQFEYIRLGLLLAFLNYCPNLEVLRFGLYNGYLDRLEIWDEPEVEPACLFTKLRVLDMHGLYGINYHMDFIEYILRIGNVLENLLVHLSYYDDGSHGLLKQL